LTTVHLNCPRLSMREKLAVEYTLSTAVLQALNSWIPPQEGLPMHAQRTD
jgi:hypothetical protein